MPDGADTGGALCIMGGPMNIYEDAAFPWLARERAFLTKQAERGIPMLGVCLGAQLLAHAHGGRVHSNPVKEIGWMPVEFTDPGFRAETTLPESITVLHWHGDTFTLPTGARLLAASAHCPHQAFVMGRSLALQFHLEAGPEPCHQMIEHCAADLAQPGPTIHSPEQILADAARHSASARSVLFSMLDWHFNSAG